VFQVATEELDFENLDCNTQFEQHCHSLPEEVLLLYKVSASYADYMGTIMEIGFFALSLRADTSSSCLTEEDHFFMSLDAYRVWLVWGCLSSTSDQIRKVNTKLHITNEHDVELLKTNTYTQRDYRMECMMIKCCYFVAFFIQSSYHCFSSGVISRICAAENKHATLHSGPSFCSQ